MNDPDGSESFILEIADDLPDGTVIFGANGTEITAEDGVYTLDAEDLEEFSLLPPLHYSSILQGVINLTTTTIVTDGNDTFPFELLISVEVEGVADPPASTSITVVAQEDEPYILGDAINLTGVLIDVSTDISGSNAFPCQRVLTLQPLADGRFRSTQPSFSGFATWCYSNEFQRDHQVCFR